jgi:fyn-related kinase
MRLKSHENKDGAFIIRASDTGGPNQLSLSVKHDKEVKHYRIVQFETGGFYINKKTVFSTIHDLVLHYSTSPDGLCINLREPCKSRPAPTTIGLSHDTHDKWEIDRSRIKLNGELGRGQFGQVYEGLFLHPTNNGSTRVAIKTLRKGSMDPEDFLREAQIMKKMNHKNLVQLFAVCTREEPVYIITELMSKGAMIDYLKTEEGKKLGLPEIIEMATQIASGMAYLEHERYVHRDLAARNILVGDHNVCKIADFGLARFIKETEYEAKAGARFPIKWTAPEAANYSKFTIKSDVWSFGIVLFEIVTKGGTPYPEMSNAEVLSCVDKGYRMPQPPNCEPKYYSIMVKCWNKNPNNRPTFESLEHELGDYFMNSEEQYREPSQFMLKNM